jgi:nitrous oxidase accessory protein
MGKGAAALLLVLVLAASSTVSVLHVKAEARTIVVPDNYPTLSLAIQNAGAGDTIFVKRGTYHEEAININKSISLIGEDRQETVLSLNPPLVERWYLHNLLWVRDSAIIINANDVKLQGFTINLPKDDYGVGSAISAVGDRTSLIDNMIANNSIYLNGSTLNVTGNSIPDALEGVGSNLIVANNTIRKTLKIQGSFNLICANKIGRGYYSNGIYFNGSFNCIVGNSFSLMEMDGCNSNFIIGNSFASLKLTKYGGGCSDNIISKNQVNGNLGINDGIWIWNGKNNTIIANSIRNCENGLLLGATGTTAVENSIYLNNFVNNTNHVASLSGSNHTVNHFDNGAKGNYYDDYRGKDANWDGVGDSPYTVQETRWEEELKSEVTIVFFQDNYPLMAPFDIDGFSVELPAWANAVANPSTEPTPTPIPTPTPSPVLPESEPFPTLLVATASATFATGFAVALLAYFKKRKH